MKRSVLLSNSGAGVCQFAQGLSSFLPLILFEKLPLWLALPADRQGLGQGALAGEEDPRVDVALYFVAPHRLRPVDIDFITRLSENVPVVRRMCSSGSQACPGCCRRLRATLASRRCRMQSHAQGRDLVP